MDISKYALVTLLIFSNNVCYSQLNQVSEENRKALGKLSNEKVVFSISNIVNITDTSGAIVGRRRIVMLEDKYLKKIKKRLPKESLLHDLFLLLNDPDRDWSANVLLYAITESSAVTLEGYESNGFRSWRKISKAEDVEKWKKYLKK